MVLCQTRQRTAPCRKLPLQGPRALLVQTRRDSARPPHPTPALRGRRGCDRQHCPSIPPRARQENVKQRIREWYRRCKPTVTMLWAVLAALLSEQGLLPTTHSAGQSSHRRETPPRAANPPVPRDTAVCVLGRMGGPGGRAGKLSVYTEQRPARAGSGEVLSQARF